MLNLFYYHSLFSGTSCSAGVGFGGDGEHIINLKEPGCGTVKHYLSYM